MALSRARNLSGLIVDTLPKDKVADAVVEAFMEATFGAEDDPDAVVIHTAEDFMSEEEKGDHALAVDHELIDLTGETDEVVDLTSETDDEESTAIDEIAGS